MEREREREIDGERERDWERVPSSSRGATIVLSEEMQNFKK